jgi:hypothetical protein
MSQTLFGTEMPLLGLTAPCEKAGLCRSGPRLIWIGVTILIVALLGGRTSRGQPAPNATSNVAAHAILNEDPRDPNSKSVAGSVVWTTETVPPGSDKPPDLQVRGNIEIPDRDMSITWILHRDTDPNSTTSHTIKINFKVPPNFPSGGVVKVPGI